MKTDGLSRLAPVTFRGPAGDLEGLLHERDPGPHMVVAVVCHPHPLYGGTLHNKVVYRVAGTLHQLGAAVLRFNFRGVGRSEGGFDRGGGEVEDARAALAFMRARHPHARCWLAGFSFGSWVAARLTAGEPDVEKLILVSPPVAQVDFEVLRESRVPKLILQGAADDVCPLEALEREYVGWAEPKRMAIVESANHFFDRRLGALAQALSQLIAEAREGPAS
jgi:alpha/beta superfamily hydrolase